MSHPLLTMKNLILLCLYCASTPVTGLEIKLDFSHDESADQFFSSNPKAQEAVEKAAADIGGLLTNRMSEVNTGYFSGVNGITQANFDWDWSYRNPINGNIETINNPSIAADTIVVYVGTRNLAGNTLAQAGVGGAGVTITGSGYPTQWIDAVDIAEANSNAVIGRGSGPVVGSISGAANFGGYVGQYDLNFGVSVGNLWFDADTNNDGSRDTNAMLANAWHYDAYTSVASGKTDLYSVAVHEILHVLGVGTTSSWNNLVNGTQWLGTATTQLAGTSNILEADGYHLIEGLESRRISDGVMQVASISPSIGTGIRKELTEIDLALLTDLGYSSVSPVPEPPGALLLGMAGMLCILRRRNNRA